MFGCAARIPETTCWTFDASQFVGSLLRQCLGDALGFPVEGYSSEACARYVGRLSASEADSRGEDADPDRPTHDAADLAGPVNDHQRDGSGPRNGLGTDPGVCGASVNVCDDPVVGGRGDHDLADCRGMVHHVPE